jgi:hypothetical protein
LPPIGVILGECSGKIALVVEHDMALYVGRRLQEAEKFGPRVTIQGRHAGECAATAHRPGGLVLAVLVTVKSAAVPPQQIERNETIVGGHRHLVAGVATEYCLRHSLHGTAPL